MTKKNIDIIDIIDITPPRFKCGDMEPTCPAVLRSNQTYVVIGKTVDLAQNPNLKQRVGLDETAIEISIDLVNEAIASQIRKPSHKP